VSTTAPNYRALFTPCIFVSSDGKVDVDFAESLQNVVDRDDDDRLYDDFFDDLPEGAQAIVDQVDRLLSEHGVSGLLRRIADELEAGAVGAECPNGGRPHRPGIVGRKPCAWCDDADDELDGVGPDGTGWVVTPGTESDQEIDLGGGWWAEAGPDEDRWAWSVWDQWTRAEDSFPLATGFSHTEAGAKSDALATYRRLRPPA
jgi:hypothetical protein